MRVLWLRLASVMWSLRSDVLCEIDVEKVKKVRNMCVYIFRYIYIYIYIYMCVGGWGGCGVDYRRCWWSTVSSFSTMGWLRLVGSLELQVSFAEYRLFHKALLQKRPVILRSLRIVSLIRHHFPLWGGYD